MEQEIIITVDEQGRTTHLLDHPLTEIPEHAEVRRASHIEPMDPCLRYQFYQIRDKFGDDSVMADRTRAWECVWQVNLSPVGGPTERWFWSRDEAIEFEINWLNRNFLGAENVK